MQGKKLTYEERKILDEFGIDTYTRLVQKHTDWEMQLINKVTREEKIITIDVKPLSRKEREEEEARLKAEAN